MIFDFQTFLPATYDGAPFGPADLLALADEAGVDHMVVMPEITARPNNADLAEKIKNQPRMIGCAAVNPAHGKEAVAEFEHAVQNLNFKGLYLAPVVHNFQIDSEAVYPLIERAQKLNVPVTTESCSENCRPVQVAALAARFPKVSFIADVGFRPAAPPVSLGQQQPSEGRIADQALEHPNLYLGLVAMATAETYLIKRLLDTISVDRLIFGSGAPSGIPLLSVGGVRQAQLGEKAEALFLGETLKKIYNL